MTFALPSAPRHRALTRSSTPTALRIGSARASFSQTARRAALRTRIEEPEGASTRRPGSTPARAPFSARIRPAKESIVPIQAKGMEERRPVHRSSASALSAIISTILLFISAAAFLVKVIAATSPTEIASPAWRASSKISTYLLEMV